MDSNKRKGICLNNLLFCPTREKGTGNSSRREGILEEERAALNTRTDLETAESRQLK